LRVKGIIGGMMRGIQERAKTHCPAGHPYSGDNLYTAPNGDRHCRTCRAASLVQWYARKKRRLGI
jgi:hypothetical protein